MIKTLLNKKHFVGVLLFSLFAIACNNKGDDPTPSGPSPDDYGRKAMLSNFANAYIIPAYDAYKNETDSLKNIVEAFINSPDSASLEAVIKQWETTLLVWQDVAFLEFGPAANIALRAQTNVYPTDTAAIEANISTGIYDLQTVANYDAKGFQAMDYLINGKGASIEETVNYYLSNSNACNYLNDIAAELFNNANTVTNEWSNTYADSFIAMNSSNSQGSSVSDLVNAVSQHFETFVRKGKVGLPLGAFNGFTETPMPGHVEAYYHGESLPFLLRSITAIQKFLKGESYVSGSNGNGLDDYLAFVEAKSNGKELQVIINDQLESIKGQLATLNDPLSNEVTTNTTGVKALYQLLQQLVSSIKVDMTNALGVLVNYQDTDGD